MDQRHFTQFYRDYVSRVYRFIFYRVGGRRDVAEDLTQDVFLKAFSAFDRYDPSISQTSWIFTIARNHLINYLQKQKPTIDLEEIENTHHDGVDWVERFALKEDEAHLWKALQTLPPQDRELIRLKHLEGWGFEDLAEKYGKSAGSLRIQAHRAMKNLKKHLKHSPAFSVSVDT